MLIFFLINPTIYIYIYIYISYFLNPELKYECKIKKMLIICYLVIGNILLKNDVYYFVKS